VGVVEIKQMVKREELVRLTLAGFSLKESSRQLGVTYQTVLKYAKQDEFLSELKVLSAEMYSRIDNELRASRDYLSERLSEASNAALETLVGLLEPTVNENIRFKAAQDLLDRNPEVSRTKKIDATHSHAFMNPLHLIHAAQTAAELDGVDISKKLGSGSNDD
jgi:hypothetical protein